ncbi:MAG: HAMP domain-containing protein, partial [Carboxydocellales bacterium]
MFIALITALLAGVVAFIFTNRLVKPIQKMVLAAKQLAAGDLSLEIPVTRSDEIGHLATAFNTMTQSFREIISHVMASAQQVAATSEALTSA